MDVIIIDIMSRLFLFRKVFSYQTVLMPYVSNQMKFIKQASAALTRLMKSDDPSEWWRLEKEVKLCETQGDAVLSEFVADLPHTIISRVDRTDLQSIAMDVDEFLDHINSAAKSVLLYHPQRIDSDLVDMAVYIEDEARAFDVMASYMEHPKSNMSMINLQCDRITELEHASDESYEEYIARLFSTEDNAIELIKYKNIAEALEDAADAGKTISDHIRELLLRYIR